MTSAPSLRKRREPRGSACARSWRCYPEQKAPGASPPLQKTGWDRETHLEAPSLSSLAWESRAPPRGLKTAAIHGSFSAPSPPGMDRLQLRMSGWDWQGFLLVFGQRGRLELLPSSPHLEGGAARRWPAHAGAYHGPSGGRRCPLGLRCLRRTSGCNGQSSKGNTEGV